MRGRGFLIVLDSVGCGGAPDAADFGDEGANTVGHIAEACAAGKAEEGRTGPLRLPFLCSLGLGDAVRLASDSPAPGLGSSDPGIAWGVAREHSIGKDTPSGHWEITGQPVPWAWHHYPDTNPAFPKELMAKAARLSGTEGTLCNTHASGTEVIEQLGQDHVETGWPILYTSVDSVLQIAAHEEHFGLERLYKLCQDLAPELHAQKLGRVIARPFVGDSANGFERTENRRDFACAPPGPTLPEVVHDAGREVWAIGKIGDIFSMRGIDRVDKGRDAALLDALDHAAIAAPPGALVFANLVEFDSLYGHRRDIAGYARALEWVDQRLSRLASKLTDEDLIIITADHGNDPSWHGTDHTRECVPVMTNAKRPAPLGRINMADIGASIAAHLGVGGLEHGENVL